MVLDKQMKEDVGLTLRDGVSFTNLSLRLHISIKANPIAFSTFDFPLTEISLQTSKKVPLSTSSFEFQHEEM